MPTSDDLTDFSTLQRDQRTEGDPRFPTGTVTFLLSDVEGSTGLWEADREIAAATIARHYDLLDSAIMLRGGARPLEQGEGDSVVAVFSRASDAIAAALDMQRALADEVWPGGGSLRIRVALHTGEAQHREQRVPRLGHQDDLEGNYSGPAIIRCARLRSIGHGGQTLVSQATHDLLVDHAADGVTWRDLGRHRLKGLGRAEHVWQLCHPDLASEFPPLCSVDAAPDELPAEVTTFVGRDSEIRRVRDALQEQRLVTLTGSGGCGKTRLALRTAKEEAGHHTAGARWVDLAQLTDPGLVPSTVATALGHHEDHGRPLLETVKEQLGALDLVAVFDNCEHLLDAVADFATQLLQALPGLRIIATSREPLGISGEMSWRVPSLDPESSRRLFVDRARQGRPAFEPDVEQLAAIARICARLDHLPLAIELAAARVRMMQPARIAQELDDRFRLLTGGGRTAVPRQQTLEASVAWSHDLLDQHERAVLRRLSVFSGGFTLEAAEAVCADELVDSYAVLDLIGRLVDKSLVQIDDASARYHLLETIRQYARERLVASDESDSVRDRHLDFFFDLAADASPTFVTEAGPDSLARVELEYDNLATALGWAEASGARERMLEMVTALALFFELRGQLANGCRWFARALEVDGPPTVVRARALWGSAHVAFYAHDYETMLRHAPAALALAEATGDTWASARALNTLGYAELWLDPSRAVDTLTRSIALGREIDDDWAIADGLKMLSVTMMTQHALDPTRTVLQELWTAAEALGNRFFLGWCHAGFAFIAWGRGDLVTARREFLLAIDDCRAVGDPATGAIAVSWLAQVEMLEGNDEAAARLLDGLYASGPGADEFNPDEPTAMASALLALRRGDPAAAIEVLEPFATVDASLVIAIWASWASMLRGAALMALDDDEGAEVALRDARRFAGAPLENPWLASAADEQLGRLARKQGRGRDAERLHHDALAVRHQHGYLPGVVDSLEALAVIAADAESAREATRLLAVCAVVRAATRLTRQPFDQPAHDDCVTRVREALGDEDFATVWAEGEALSVDEAVAYVSRARSERKRPASGWDALTPTERSVVALAAEGLTNPQIAERLFIARGTVKIHLSHIFAKLGVATRAELASEATRRTVHATTERGNRGEAGA